MKHLQDNRLCHRRLSMFHALAVQGLDVNIFSIVKNRRISVCKYSNISCLEMCSVMFRLVAGVLGTSIFICKGLDAMLKYFEDFSGKWVWLWTLCVTLEVDGGTFFTYRKKS